ITHEWHPFSLVPPLVPDVLEDPEKIAAEDPVELRTVETEIGEPGRDASKVEAAGAILDEPRVVPVPVAHLSGDPGVPAVPAEELVPFVARVPFAVVRPDADVLDADQVDDILDVPEEILHRRPPVTAAHHRGPEGHADDPAPLRQHVEDVVGGIPTAGVNGPRIGMRDN